MNKETMFSSMETEDFIELFGTIQVLTGMKPTTNVQTNPSHARYFIEQLQKRFPKVKFREAEVAFEIYANSDVNRYAPKTLTIQSISQVLRNHVNNLNSDWRNNEYDEPQLSEEEKLETVIRGMVSEFNRYKSGSTIFNYGNSTHDYLNEWGLLGFTDEEMKAITKKAEDSYVRSLTYRKSAHNAFKINDAISDFLDGGTHSEFTKYLGIEKVSCFFNSLEEVSMDLLDVLIQKKIVTDKQVSRWGILNTER